MYGLSFEVLLELGACGHSAKTLFQIRFEVLFYTLEGFKKSTIYVKVSL